MGGDLRVACAISSSVNNCINGRGRLLQEGFDADKTKEGGLKAIFHCAGGDQKVLENHYKQVIYKEFYDGEIGSASDGPINLFLEKGLEYPISIVHLCTPNRITYRRSQHHIRVNQVNVYVVWLIRRGGLKLSRTNGSFSVNEDQIMVFDSSTPFFAELECDDRGVHDSLQAVIPAHLFREYLGGLSECHAVLDIKRDKMTVAHQMIELLAKHGHGLSRDVATTLSNGLLQSIGETLTSNGAEKMRKSIADRRLEDIEQFVTRNLTNRDLSTNLIAEACKISPRYLCYILKSAGYTFSQLVWDKRLERAKAWLTSPNMESYLVHEIASMAGYTSAAHFSRIFKAACGCTPTEHRQKMLSEEIDDLEPEESLH
jgi:AraC-like DNA-binding protein